LRLFETEVAAVAAAAAMAKRVWSPHGIVVGVVVVFVGMGLGDMYRLIRCEKCGKCDKCNQRFCADFAWLGQNGRNMLRPYGYHRTKVQIESIRSGFGVGWNLVSAGEIEG